MAVLQWDRILGLGQGQTQLSSSPPHHQPRRAVQAVQGKVCQPGQEADQRSKTRDPLMCHPAYPGRQDLAIDTYGSTTFTFRKYDILKISLVRKLGNIDTLVDQSF